MLKSRRVTTKQKKTSSSAVAKKPRGVSCLSVVSFNSTKRRNVYDKKPRRYAKDNRTAHLTARSDKSVAYVTNNKRLYSTFCTVEAHY